jgi:hypothetical protein
MLRKINALFWLSVLFFESNMVFAMGIGQLEYYPHVQVIYSLAPFPDEPAKFREGITTDENLSVDKPFYVMVNAAIKSDSVFKTSTIDCAIEFSNPQIITVRLIERKVQVRELEAGRRYAFRIPVTKSGDEIVRLVFYCEPQSSGSQNIRIKFDENVAPFHEQFYDCLIKEKEIFDMSDTEPNDY